MDPTEPIISRDYILKNSGRIDKKVDDLVHDDPKTSRVAFEKILKQELFLANVPFANLVENLSADELESLDATNQKVIELFQNKRLDREKKGILEKTALQLKQNIEDAISAKKAQDEHEKGKERVEESGSGIDQAEINKKANNVMNRLREIEKQNSEAFFLVRWLRALGWMKTPTIELNALEEKVLQGATSLKIEGVGKDKKISEKTFDLLGEYCTEKLVELEIDGRFEKRGKQPPKNYENLSKIPACVKALTIRNSLIEPGFFQKLGDNIEALDLRSNKIEIHKKMDVLMMKMRFRFRFENLKFKKIIVDSDDYDKIKKIEKSYPDIDLRTFLKITEPLWP